MGNENEVTATKYLLVVHEVAADTASIWVGALHPSLGMPRNWRLRVQEHGEGKPWRELGPFTKDDWQRPFSGIEKRFYRVQTITGLAPRTQYDVVFEGRYEHQYRELARGKFTTLPAALPGAGERPFTVMSGSCFYYQHDGGQAAHAYASLYDHGERLKPDIKLLTGDQVYLDIGLGWYPLSKSDVADRVADEYARNWELLGEMLSRGGTWMLPDDHEYWNDYPFFEGINPYLVTLEHHDRFQADWRDSTREGVDRVQQVSPVREFTIGGDLSFCIADLRTHRDRGHFIDQEHFERITGWAHALTSPGVLALPQPLIVKPGGATDKTLANFEVQYSALIQALAASGHDIVLMTGDVHYGRIDEVLLGRRGGRLIEVVSSPMSNLAGLANSIATAVAPKETDPFPPYPIADLPERRPRVRRRVGDEFRWYDLRYVKGRTYEHFMTSAFRRHEDGITMSVQAWRCRKFDKAGPEEAGRPKPGFRRIGAFETVLQ